MTSEQRFDILKIELSLIQATLDKYDDLIFRGRNSFVTLWLAALGFAFTIKSDALPLLVVALSLVYWFLEGMMRHQYWFKYVDRYRFLRDSINAADHQLGKIAVYDLTNHFHRTPVSSWNKFRSCFLKAEPSVLYGLMGALALAVWLFLHNGVLHFPGKG